MAPKSEQGSLLNLPDMRVDAKIATSMARIVRDSGLSREQALDELNRAAMHFGVNLSSGNGKLSLATFEKWLNPNETTYTPRTEALNIFCRLFQSNTPLQILLDAQGLGFRLIDREEVKVLEYGRLILEEKSRKARKRTLEAELK